MHNEILLLEQALDDGNIMLAKRYAGKIRARLYCQICGEKVYFNDESEDYYKARAHKKCIISSGGVAQ